MAYRRRQGITRVSTFKEDLIYNNNDNNENRSSDHSPNSAPASASASPSLAAQAIRASAAARRDYTFFKPSSHHQDTATSYNYTTDEAGGFWSVVARKAKSILDDDDDDDNNNNNNMSREFGTHNRENGHMPNNSTYSAAGQFFHPYHYAPGMSRKVENPTLRKGLDALTSSLNQIGDSIGNALEEGRSLAENKTADIIQETRKLQIRRKGTNSTEQIHLSGVRNPWQEPVMSSVQPQMQSNQETQLKASRDVAMATAAKAKLLLRELKTTKAYLAFAKQRCSQLEEENKILREAYEKGDHPADEDMIRLQLETLLEEKARLAHENSIYARENRFLREIIEYHQLTMQDVVYLDEGIEEVTEVYPVPAISRMRSGTPTSPRSPRTPSRISAVSWDSCPSISRDSFASIPLQAIPNVIQDETSPTTSVQLQAITDLPKSVAPPSSSAPVSTPKGSIRRSNRYA